MLVSAICNNHVTNDMNFRMNPAILEHEPELNPQFSEWN
jgi:hypothetical protein